MDDVASVAAASTDMSRDRLEIEVALRTMKMAQVQQAAALELLIKTMEMTVTGVGQVLDVRA